MDEYLSTICYNLLKETFVEQTKRVLEYSYEYMRQNPDKVDMKQLQALRKNFQEIDALRDLQKTLSFHPNYNSTQRTPRMKVSWNTDENGFTNSSRSAFNASEMKVSKTINLNDSSEIDGAWGGSSPTNKSLKRSPGTSGFGSGQDESGRSAVQSDDARYTVRTRVNLQMPDGTKKSTITSFTGPNLEEALSLVPTNESR